METDKKGKNLTLNDFLLLSVIGKGSYAKVLLVKKKDTGEVLAMKVLKKEMIEKRKQEEHVKTERNVLVDVVHPFVVKLAYAFQNDRKLFFALEYCPGGELFSLLQKRKVFTEDHSLPLFPPRARFYAVQILLAIEHLHSKHVVYRDLKPENVLIDSKGFLRVTDFGLSKKNVKGMKDAFSVCGTPEYLAPEVLLKKGHGKPVDWWSFGCFLYEMLTGLPPFYTKTREELFEKIKFESPKLPAKLSTSAKDLIQNLLNKDPEQRLGSGPSGAREIKNHSWFSGVDWESYLRKEVKPPFVPKIKGELDVSNFDPEFTETAVDSYKDGFMNQKVYGSYEGFTWTEDTIVKDN